MRCELRRVPTNVLIEDVGSVFDRRPDETIEDPSSVFDVFNPPRGKPFEPAITMNATGTWNIPALLVEHEQGFAYDEQQFPNRRLWLIEGHQRLRYLRALTNSGRGAAVAHDVLVLRLAE